MEHSVSFPSASHAPSRNSLPVITITTQIEDDYVEEECEGIQLHQLHAGQKQCCTLFLWTGKHQKCCKDHPSHRRKTAEISIVWFYFVLLMLFLCLFFVIFLSVIKGF
ncbi:hypothetical protein L3Y34_013532 [Caenorhabditis briggsae]|uniref:Uncharacterized protein n=1 Tax=Caenorhabditis briggsae TaxID=6238 RepID=A0AAE8ZRV7_CAEBR|nr:hypothetical protein L3Y34_013532 [Caenorhabditis briggsae]